MVFCILLNEFLPTSKDSAPLAALLDPTAKPTKRRNPKLARRLEKIMEQKCSSVLVFQVQGICDIFHMDAGFIACGRHVQSPDAVFFSKLSMVYGLHSSLKEEPQSWKGLQQLLPILVNILIFLWDLPEKALQAHSHAERAGGRGRGRAQRAKASVVPLPPKEWHCVFWFFTQPWKDKCLNFLACMEMFLITRTFKNVACLDAS